MNFPTFVYKTPGQHSGNGFTYSYKIVKNEEEVAEMLEEGYFVTLPEAIEKKSKQIEEVKIETAKSDNKKQKSDWKK